MYEYIKGQLASLEPTQAVIDCGGVGYLLEISLNTYEALRRADGDMPINCLDSAIWQNVKCSVC